MWTPLSSLLPCHKHPYAKSPKSDTPTPLFVICIRINPNDFPITDERRSTSPILFRSTSLTLYRISMPIGITTSILTYKLYDVNRHHYAVLWHFLIITNR